MAPVVTAHIILLSPALLLHRCTQPTSEAAWFCHLFLNLLIFISFLCMFYSFTQISSAETPLGAGCWWPHLVSHITVTLSLTLKRRPDWEARLGWLAAGGLGAACHPIVCNHRGHGHHNQCHIWTRHQAPYRSSSLNSWSGGRCQPGPGSIAFMQIYLLPMTGTLSCLIHRPLSHHPTHHH